MIVILPLKGNEEGVLCGHIKHVPQRERMLHVVLPRLVRIGNKGSIAAREQVLRDPQKIKLVEFERLRELAEQLEYRIEKLNKDRRSLLVIVRGIEMSATGTEHVTERQPLFFYKTSKALSIIR